MLSKYHHNSRNVAASHQRKCYFNERPHLSNVVIWGKVHPGCILSHSHCYKHSTKNVLSQVIFVGLFTPSSLIQNGKRGRCSSDHQWYNRVLPQSWHAIHFSLAVPTESFTAIVRHLHLPSCLLSVLISTHSSFFLLTFTLQHPHSKGWLV